MDILHPEEDSQEELLLQVHLSWLLWLMAVIF